jgi:uncharacterized protein YkwD
MKTITIALFCALSLLACNNGFKSKNYFDPLSGFGKGTPDQCGAFSGAACTVFNDINAIRMSAGRAALGKNSNCQNLAQSHAEDMAANDFLSHASPTHGNLAARATQFGIADGNYAENIGEGAEPQDIVSSWQVSSVDNANMLSASFKSAGSGYSVSAAGVPVYAFCFTSKTGDL